jgi:NADH-quinone oxidoreductase subunit K
MTLTNSQILLVAVLCLTGAGLYCLLAMRNLIKIIVALQILAKAAVLALLAAGDLSGQLNLSQSLALTVIVADTIVAAVALAMAVQVRRLFGSMDLGPLSQLKG